MRAIVRCVLWCWLLALGLCLHFVKQAVEVLLVVDEAYALVDAGEVGRPVRFPGASLDTDVGHGLLLGEAAFHEGNPSQVRPSNLRPAAFFPTFSIKVSHIECVPSHGRLAPFGDIA